MDTIGNIIREIAPYTTLYAFAATMVMMVTIMHMKNNRAKYIHWKSAKINLLGVYKTEWERNDDVLLNELWEENRLLEAKLKLVNKDLTNLSAVTIFILGIISLREKFKKQPENKSNK